MGTLHQSFYGSVLKMLIQFLAICLLFLFLWKRYMDGFKKWNHLPHVKPHWFWGNRPVFSKCLKDIILDHYNALGENKFGLYWYLNEATIFIKDKDLIKRVQVVDFDHFTDLGFTPEGQNQFGLSDVKGEPWRKMKRQLTPSFSVPRLKKNVETMNEVASQLTGYLHSIENREYVEVLDFTKKYFLNCIASVGFGLRMDCFGEKKSGFEKAAETVFDEKGYLVMELFPNVAKLFGISLVSKKFNKFFGDGYESASQVFGFLIYQIVVNPDVQAQLYEEIDDIFN